VAATGAAGSTVGVGDECVNSGEVEGFADEGAGGAGGGAEPCLSSPSAVNHRRSTTLTLSSSISSATRPPQARTSSHLTHDLPLGQAISASIRRALYCTLVGRQHPFDALVALSERLRGPDGCPWDREQTLETLKTYIIEEAYEVVDAIDKGDRGTLSGELGDLLFQIVFAAQLARENGWFDVEEVCRRIHAKMVYRHPHVFGDTEVADAGQVVRNWEALKARERQTPGALAGVPPQLPALLKALRITEKAAALGFDWERTNDVVAKLREEVQELIAELGPDPALRAREKVRDELGDVLFVIANLARQLGVDPEAALQGVNEKFARRFRTMEEEARARGVTVGSLPLSELDALWEAAKKSERGP
jgi:MazG family protein